MSMFVPKRRDPRRISEVLSLLEHYWRRNPDLRLGQIVGNAASGDPYYYEDGQLMKQLQEWLEAPTP